MFTKQALGINLLNVLFPVESFIAAKLKKKPKEKKAAAKKPATVVKKPVIAKAKVLPTAVVDIVKDLSPRDRASALYQAGYISLEDYQKQIAMYPASSASTTTTTQAGLFTPANLNLLMYGTFAFIVWKFFIKDKKGKR